jgi:hypothetical protein
MALSSEEPKTGRRTRGGGKTAPTWVEPGRHRRLDPRIEHGFRSPGCQNARPNAMRTTLPVLLFVSILGACGSDSDKAVKPPEPAPAVKPDAGKGDATPAKKDADPAAPKPDAAKPDAAKSGDQKAAGDPVAAMDAAIATLMAKPEHGADKITVAHILIAFKGAPRIQGVTRSLEEAKALAADVYKRSVAGEDFNALMKQYTNDSVPGTYPMSKDPTASNSRTKMVPGFGDVGWRLQVGEIGVAPHDNTKSPFGWHIIKRVE